MLLAVRNLFDKRSKIFSRWDFNHFTISRDQYDKRIQHISSISHKTARTEIFYSFSIRRVFLSRAKNDGGGE